MKELEDLKKKEKEKAEEVLLRAVRDMTDVSTELGISSIERMQLSQAALNLSHTYATLSNCR